MMNDPKFEIQSLDSSQVMMPDNLVNAGPLTAVEQIAAAMKNGAKFPAPVVYYDGEDYWLAEGGDYLSAASMADIELDCEVRPGTMEDAAWHSFSTVKSALSSERRFLAALRALRHRKVGELIDNFVAEYVGAPLELVTKLREQEFPALEDDEEYEDEEEEEYEEEEEFEEEEDFEDHQSILLTLRIGSSR